MSGYFIILICQSVVINFHLNAEFLKQSFLVLNLIEMCVSRVKRWIFLNHKNGKFEYFLFLAIISKTVK